MEYLRSLKECTLCGESECASFIWGGEPLLNLEDSEEKEDYERRAKRKNLDEMVCGNCGCLSKDHSKRLLMNVREGWEKEREKEEEKEERKEVKAVREVEEGEALGSGAGESTPPDGCSCCHEVMQYDTSSSLRCEKCKKVICLRCMCRRRCHICTGRDRCPILHGCALQREPNPAPVPSLIPQSLSHPSSSTFVRAQSSNQIQTQVDSVEKVEEKKRTKSTSAKEKEGERSKEALGVTTTWKDGVKRKRKSKEVKSAPNEG